jgi:YidC/Oxa1 family membrane protein insertase
LILHFAAIPLLGPISEFFAKILQFFNSFTGSFGWNVILLTVAFRIVVLPLSFKQTKSMIAMQRLQPQLKEIQKKYKDDREKQGQEMMRLYKENKVSPLGGCLPLILQLPILFALFEVLRNVPKYVHYQTSFKFLGIGNLIATGNVLWRGGFVPVQDPNNYAKWIINPKNPVTHYPGGEYLAVIILILLTIITGYISSKMMTNDPKQAKMMMLMPVIFGVFAWILPAGVTLYIITTNVLMAIQQYVQLEAEGFYDEKRVLRLKTGEPFKWYERWRFKGYDVGSRVLTALRIKKRAKPEEEKPAAKGEKVAATGKGPAGKAARPPAGKKGTKPSGAQPAKKTGGEPGGKKPAGKKPAGKKPAGKKPVSKKPPSKKPGLPPAEKKPEEDTDTTWGHEPEPAPKTADETTTPDEQTKPQAPRVDKSKQYPAKKKGSKKK